MSMAKQAIQTIKEEYEKAEKQKIDFLFEVTAEDASIQTLLILYTLVFNYTTQLNDSTAMDKLFEYAYFKATSFVEKCYQEIKDEPFEPLEAYCKYYQLIKKYISFSVSVFKPIYKKLELKNVFVVKRLMDYQFGCFQEVQEEVVEALNQELNRVRAASEVSSELVDVAFESLEAFAFGPRVRVEKVANAYVYVCLMTTKGERESQLPSEVLVEVRKVLEDQVSRFHEEYKDESVDQYIDACVKFYKLEQQRVARYYPALKATFEATAESVLFEPKQHEVLERPILYLLELLLAEKVDTIQALVEIFALKHKGAERIHEVLVEFITIRFGEMASLSLTITEIFEKFEDFYKKLESNLFGYFGHHKDIIKRIEEEVYQLLKPLEEEFIQWVVDRVNSLIIECTDPKEFKAGFSSIAIYFRMMRNRKTFIDLYEQKFKDRHLHICEEISLNNEQLATGFIEQAFNQYLVFESLGSLLYDIALSRSFRDGYKYAFEFLGKLLVVGTESWGVSPKEFDSWDHFCDLLERFGESLPDVAHLADKLVGDYSHSKRDAQFLPSLNTFELEYASNGKTRTVVVNGWQFVALLVLDACGGKVEVSELNAVMAPVPVDICRLVLESLEASGLIKTSDGYISLNTCSSKPGADINKHQAVDLFNIGLEAHAGANHVDKPEVEKYAFTPKIVRLLKQNARMNATNLYNTVNEWRSLSEPDFAEYIDALMQKDIIIRDKLDPNVLIYDS